MRVLVIGGTRFLGPHIVRQLLERGCDVAVFHRGKTLSPSMPRVRLIQHESAGAPIRRFPDEVLATEPDVVIHTYCHGEPDAHAAVHAFRGRAGRLVALSSGDVYLSYGRFTGSEPGAVVEGPDHEDSPLRTVLYPYCRPGITDPDSIEYYYEKILMEKAAASPPDLPATILRLPKLYGVEDNRNLGSVYGARAHPAWRWTHGYVGNVAHAVVLAATHPGAAGRIYNVGEASTPTVAERLAALPPEPADPGPLPPQPPVPPFDFSQDLVLDTGRIRAELGYEERWDERDMMRRIAAGEDPHC